MENIPDYNDSLHLLSTSHVKHFTYKSHVSHVCPTSSELGTMITSLLHMQNLRLSNLPMGTQLIWQILDLNLSLSGCRVRKELETLEFQLKILGLHGST